MKADPFAQLKLLDVQELDSKLDQLQHQLATMPETQEVTALGAAHGELIDTVRDAQIRVDEFARAQRKADADVEQVKARRTRDQDRMAQGLVTNPKDLDRMQQELVSLERRISHLEDDELEVMESLETAQGELNTSRDQLTALEEQIESVASARDAKAASINEQLASVGEERKVTASGVPEDLLVLYTKLRTQKGGVGVGALRSRRCGGCGLDVNASDMGIFAKAPSNEVIRCEECDRILVRTAESGLR